MGHRQLNASLSTRALARSTLLLPILLFAAGCSNDEQAAPTAARGGTASICLVSQPDALNPFVSEDQYAADLLPLLFTPLVRFGADHQPGPWLARSWAWDAEHRQLTFELRDDVRWHDGQPVTAEDVAWTIRAAADPAYAYWLIEDFMLLEGVEVLAPGRVQVRFSKPPFAALEALAALPILPRHLLEGPTPEEFARTSYHNEPVGSGPFRFAGRRDGGTIVLERFADFPAELGQPRLDRILLRAIPEVSAQLVELGTGAVQGCVMNAVAAEEAQKDGTLEVIKLELPNVQVIPLRNDRPPFDDARVRRAVSAALDRREIAQVVSSLASPAGNFLPPENPFRSDSLNQVNADPALAAALLDSAGWRLDGRDPIRRNAAGAPLRFTIHGPAPYRDLLTVVQAQLRRAGMDAQLELQEPATYFGTLVDPATRPGMAMSLAFTPTRGTAFDPYPELHSEGQANLSSYHSEPVDALVEELRTALDPAARSRIYRALQSAVASDVPTVYTVYVPRTFAHRRELTGVRAGPDGPFSSVVEWSLQR